jgi:hypothetical protein
MKDYNKKQVLKPLYVQMVLIKLFW